MPLHTCEVLYGWYGCVCCVFVERYILQSYMLSVVFSWAIMYAV